MRFGALVILLFALTESAAAGDWPQLRGPNLDGKVDTTSVFGAGFGLETAWRRPLGPAYSGVAVVGNRAVTLFSDGVKDVAVALDAGDGRELWRTPFADTYRGHDGSTDGPVGTPTLDRERVYFVGPFGDLLALSLEDGRILWRKHLGEDFDAPKPVYGYSSTPWVSGDLLLVQAGGSEERSVVAFDRLTGEVRWTAAQDWINHQNPVTARVEGKPVLVSVGALRVTAVSPLDGAVLWSHEHSDKPGFDPTFPQPVMLGDDRILLTFDAEAVLYAIEAAGLKEVWRSRGLKKTTATPVVFQDHLYGFDGRFLTCVRAADGETVWKSRQPGGRGLIVVDEHLVILGSGGNVVVAEASPEGYREKARKAALDAGAYTAPSFAGGSIFVRNLREIAAVRIVPDQDSSRIAEAESSTGSDAGRLTKQIRAIRSARAADKARLVDQLMASVDSFPVIENGTRATFIYRGAASAVSVTGHMLGDQQVPEPLDHIAGTDFFYRTYELEPEGRWHYRFLVDFEDPQPDPRNPAQALGESEVLSELVMPKFQDPDWLKAEPVAGAGRLESVTVDSKAYGESFEVQVYLPAGYDGRKTFPLWVLPNGEQWLEAGITRAFDQLFSEADSAVVALVPIRGWVGGQWGGRAVQHIGDELLPLLDGRYRLNQENGSAALWTVQEKAAIAMDLIRAHQRFGHAVFQSPRTYRGQPESLGAERAAGLRFFISWSRYESRSAEQGVDEVAAAREMAEHLANEGATVQTRELSAGPGFRTWRTELAEIIKFLTENR